MDENFNLNEEKKAEDYAKAGLNHHILAENADIEETEANTEAEDLTEQTENENVPLFVPIPISPEEKEKREIKRLARVCGISFLSFYALMLGLGFFIGIILGIFVRDFDRINAFLEEPAIMQVYQILFSILVFTVPFTIIFKLFKFRISDLISFTPKKEKNQGYFYLIGICFCAFANVAATYAESFFDSAGISYEVENEIIPEGFFGFVLSFLATAIVPALVEEFACRGIVLGALRKKGEAFAIICSSLLFGLMHGNFEQIPFAILVGLILGFITIKTENIWIAVAVHFTNNAISVIYNYILGGLSSAAQNISYTIYLIACMLAGIYAFIKLSKDENIFKLSKGEAVGSLSLRLKHFFTSAPVIIFVAICILGSLQYFS